MKDVFHQMLFLLLALLVVTLGRWLLGPYIRFLGSTSIVLYLVIDGVLLLVVIGLWIAQQRTNE